MSLVLRVVGWLVRVLPDALVRLLAPPVFRYSPNDVPPPPGRLDASTRLYVAPVNWAGQGKRWAQAAERHLPGVRAVNMAYRLRGDFSHEADFAVPVGAYVASTRWQRRQFEAVVHNFTHVLIEAVRQPFGAVLDESVEDQVHRLQAAGLHVAMVSHGSDIRLPSRHAASHPDSPFKGSEWNQTAKLERSAAKAARVLERLGVPTFVSTPDLLIDVPQATWLPVVVDVERWATDSPPLAKKVPLVVHAPSKDVIKGSDLIEPVLRRMESEGLLVYRRVHGVPAHEVVGIYREADIVLDQFRLGDYGVAACEAMAAGRVVVAYVSEHSRSHVRAATGRELPIVDATVATLEHVLRDILDRRDEYREVAAAGTNFVRAVHDGRLSAAALRSFLEQPAPGR